MFAILAAAAMALPVPDRSLEFDVARDLPREVEESDFAVMWYEAFVGPDGTIDDCVPRVTMGGESVFETVCETVKGRHVEAAIGPDGEPISGFFRGHVSLADNAAVLSKYKFQPDIKVHVRSLPEGAKKGFRLDLVVRVDEGGNIRECEADDGAQALLQSACEQAALVTLPVRMSRSGQAVSYVYPLIVEFTDEPLPEESDEEA